ncbi:MAG: hypothetical protein ACLRFE_00660 [Clostridia bacterium]
MEIEEGKVIDLQDGKSYLVSKYFMHDDQEYVALVAVFEPVHVRYAEVYDNNGEKFIRMVQDKALIKLFQQYIAYDYFSAIEEDEDEE